MSCGLESDSVNEHSPARPSLRRKRKFKRMSVDGPQPQQSGKRKRSQRFELSENAKCMRHPRIKPLHQSIVDKIEKFFPVNNDASSMEVMDIATPDDNFEVASESSLSWSEGEGHEGDDELTDWAPTLDVESAWNDNDDRQIRAGCRRVLDERPGFSISTGLSQRVAKFLQDSTKTELRLSCTERVKLDKLAALYFLSVWRENANSLVLRKTPRTPCMQPTQRHHFPLVAPHKRIRTNSHAIS